MSNVCNARTAAKADDIPPVELPERRRAEQHRAARRQTVQGQCASARVPASRTSAARPESAPTGCSPAPRPQESALRPAATLAPNDRSGWSLPPTIPTPIWLSKKPKTGTFETSLSRIKAWFSSNDNPSASRSNRP